MLKPSATSRSFPPLPSASSNLSNAPAKLRRACAATHSATGLPRAASFSRLLAGTSLRGFAPSVRATAHAPRGLTQREADRAVTRLTQLQLNTPS